MDKFDVTRASPDPNKNYSVQKAVLLQWGLQWCKNLAEVLYFSGFRPISEVYREGDDKVKQFENTHQATSKTKSHHASEITCYNEKTT